MLHLHTSEHLFKNTHTDCPQTKLHVKINFKSTWKLKMEILNILVPQLKMMGNYPKDVRLNGHHSNAMFFGALLSIGVFVQL